VLLFSVKLCSPSGPPCLFSTSSRLPPGLAFPSRLLPQPSLVFPPYTTRLDSLFMPSGKLSTSSNLVAQFVGLSWAERFARNARVPTASQVTIRLFGVPEGFAISLGLATA